MPFAALTDYADVLEETARLTESDQTELDHRLTWLADHLAEEPSVTLTCFVPDEAKEGGRCKTVTGAVRRIDAVNRMLMLEDGTIG